ncbi:hypothetical protein IV203_036911 [Nitzschia inconspicua]|uniref:Uncharacterized protein n=1 Tax=Nitzschia inconspicua TaxID=303405 RepID=A0A9K3PW75_9STRA|nr:hypothetical protein IV203_036911 [Nitzschia inconspicua]
MSSATANNANPTTILAVPKGSADSSGARFTLRKRPNRPDGDAMSLSSYNSAFLSGLFADVAKANVCSEFELPEPSKGSVTFEETTNLIEDVRPSKRSRLSLALCRSRASCMNLASFSTGMQSPKGINEIFSFQKTEASLGVNVEPTNAPKLSDTSPLSDENLSRQDSLAFQLSLLENEDGPSNKGLHCNARVTSKDVAILAFPNLPATVSDSSCYTGLTRENLARHAPIPENDDCSSSNGPDKESFGWFVDLDDQHQATPCSVSTLIAHAVSTNDLAFQAPTAPKRPTDDSEIEWAQAADTVDSVLGDLF